MKKLVLVAFLLALAPRAAAGSGSINFTWGPWCWEDQASAFQAFACNTNAGATFFSGSFMPSSDQPAFVGIVATVDGVSESTQLPDWWQLFNPGSCRQTSLSVSTSFADAPGGCVDPWSESVAGGIGVYQTSLYPPPLNVPMPNRLRLQVAFAMPFPAALLGGVEYYGFRARLDYAKTVGPGACGGCGTGLLLVLEEIQSTEANGAVDHCVNPLNETCLRWQTSQPICVVSTRPTTWGRVKSLYR